ncbi:MAG: cation:proton antiporter [Myxococcaceae bacterium]|nr:cation:proton antiporter [Myxococcaceae bacterium]
MHGAHGFLTTLTIVLCVAAVTTVVFQRLRQPVVLGYLMAGLIVGPYVAVPLAADPAVVQTLSELGVILLMFSLGLEFRIKKLVQLGPTAGITALIECSLMVWLGFVAGRAFGWGTRECLFAGALIAISSTTIIARAFNEQGVRGQLREQVVGILIVEDLIAVLLMALLTAVSTGHGLSATELGLTSGKLFAFLAGLICFGLLVVPRSIRAVVKLDRPETTLVASVGLCFAISQLARGFGYSVALGAFIAGTLVAESGEDKRIEHLVQPVRDLFAAIFFVSVGMLINPKMILDHWPAVLVFSVLVIAGKIVAVSVGSFLTGNGTRASVQAGMSLAQIGEFSFIIAGLGVSLKATGDFLYPMAVAVSGITTLTTPALIKASPAVAAFIDRTLPAPLQTFAALYATWIDRLRSTPRRERAGAQLRRLVLLLLGDVVLLLAVLVAASLSAGRAAQLANEQFGLPYVWGVRLTIAGGVVLASPLFIGVVRLGRRLAVTLANFALPPKKGGGTDLAMAPRRALMAALQIALGLMVVVPVVTILQPFFPGVTVPTIAGVVLLAFAVVFWKSAQNLEGHVRAGAQVLVEVLAAQSHPTSDEANASEGAEHALAQAEVLLPGLGAPTAVRLEPTSAAVGRTLAELNLRGRTGATVLAIHREGADLPVPGAKEVLRADDVLAIAGTTEAVQAAKQLLQTGAVVGGGD